MSAHLNTAFLSQLLAACDRALDVENWAGWGAVEVAAAAIRGDVTAQNILRQNQEWQLDAEGRLP